MTTTHEQTAREVARDTMAAAPVATELARQGDVVLVRIGDPVSEQHAATPDYGVQIAAGQHGEHRLIGDAVKWLRDGCVSTVGLCGVVHTDVPKERHGTIQLAPGTWQYHQSRELFGDQVVQVKD